MSQRDCREGDAARKLQSLARTYLVQSRWKKYAPDAVEEIAKQALLALRRSRRKFSLGECKVDEVGQTLSSHERRMPKNMPGGDAGAIVVSTSCRSAIAKIQRRFAARKKHAARHAHTARHRAAYHGHTSRRSFPDTRSCVARLQANLRRRRARRSFLLTVSAVLQVQSYWRCHLRRRAFDVLKTSVVRSQALHRGNQARREAHRLRSRCALQGLIPRCIDKQERKSRHSACVRIQSLERGRRQRAQVAQVAHASTMLQARLRGRKIRNSALLQRRSCVRIQSLQRRAMVRKISALLVVARTRIQALQRGRGIRQHQRCQRAYSAPLLISYCKAVETPRDVETSPCTRLPALEEQGGVRRNTNLRLKSVVRLQALLRGRSVRRYISKRVVCATKIQALQRGRHFRCEIADVRVSATLILAVMRRTRWRRQANLHEHSNPGHVMAVSRVGPSIKRDDSSSCPVNECIWMGSTSKTAENSRNEADGDKDPGALATSDDSAGQRQPPCAQDNHASRIHNINLIDDTKMAENTITGKDNENDLQLASLAKKSNEIADSRDTRHDAQRPATKSYEGNSVDATKLVEIMFKNQKHDTGCFSSAVPLCSKTKNFAPGTQRIPKGRSDTTPEGSSEDTSDSGSRNLYDAMEVAKRKTGIAAYRSKPDCDKEPDSAWRKQILRQIQADGTRVHQTYSRPNDFNQEYPPQLVLGQSNKRDIPQPISRYHLGCGKECPDTDSEIACRSHSAIGERQKRVTSTSIPTSPERPPLHKQIPLSGPSASYDSSVARLHEATASGNATAAALLLRELKMLRQSVESLEENFKLMRVTPQATEVNIKEADHTVDALQSGSCAKGTSDYQKFNGSKNFWTSAEACLQRNDIRMAVKIVLGSRHTRMLLKLLARDDLLGERSPPILVRLEPSLLERLFDAITMLLEQRRYARFVVPWIYSAIRDGVIGRLPGQKRVKIANGLREIANRETDNVAASLVPHILGNF